MIPKQRVSVQASRGALGAAKVLGLAFLILPFACPASSVAQVVITQDAPQAGGPAPFALGPPQPPPQPADAKTFPRTPDGKPDLVGIWNPGMGALGGAGGPPEPLTPTYEAKHQERERATKAGTPYADQISRCEAFGMPRMMSMLGLEFIETPGKQITIIEETLHEVRRIYLDGRSRPADYDPAFDGYSVGHWEGDVLVVDTTGLHDNDDANGWLGPHAHIVERISMINPNAIKNEFTVTDPERLTGEWKFTRTYTRAPKDYQMSEYICTENNRNLPDANGFQTAK